MTKTGVERAIEYCSWVEKNPSKVCHWVKQAVKRFRKDYSEALKPESKYYFDEQAANRFIAFAEQLKHFKGPLAGTKMVLEPWQCFIFANVYGFKKRSDDTRRFTKSFIFCARKQGKSQMMIAVLLWDLLTTPGAEAYTAATKKEQAKIVFDAVKHAIRQNDALSSRLKIYNSTDRITNEKLAGKIEALSAESDKMDGLGPSVVVVDELAAMKNFDIIKILQSGQGARPSPLLFEITSGSDNQTSAGKQEYDRSCQILDNVFEDESYFCILYTLDKNDDWKDESKWGKANPNLGVSVDLEFLRKFCKEAQQQPAMEVEFRTKCCTQWLSNQSAWISAKSWQKCEENAKNLKLDLTKPYFAVGAIDLSKRNDLTVFSIIAYQTGKFFIEHRMYFPMDSLNKRIKRENELWRKWLEEGEIIAIPGEVINYAYMNKDIDDLAEIYNLSEILFDPYNSTSLINDLGEKYNLVEIQQSIKQLSPYAKAFEEEVLAGNIVDGNKVAKWAANNCQVYIDPNGNLKPIKIDANKESRHIDSVITTLMGVGRIKNLIDNGEIDLRTADEVQEDTKAFLDNLKFW